METARVLTDGRGQTVSIPQAYRFDVDEVFVSKIGNALILTPVSELAAAFDRGAAMLTDDFLADGVPVSVPAPAQPQKRLGLLEGKLHVPDDFDAPLPPYPSS